MLCTYKNRLKDFTFSQEGAVTIDYVILLAGMVGLAVAGSAAVRSSTAGANTAVGTAAADVAVTATF